jgi:TetR/AcrR family transcriptional regulator, repressor for neighboring sulfatase
MSDGTGSPIGGAPTAGGSRRGPDAVRRSLIDATLDLISQRSPATVTNKEIAARAGVNHGQIHHYFDSKDDLVAHAIMEASSRLGAEPPGLLAKPGLEHTTAIWRALAYLVVNSDSIGVTSPIIATIVKQEAASRGVAFDDPDLIADVAAFVALSSGWAVFGDHVIGSLAEFGIDSDSLHHRLSHHSGTLLASQQLEPER